MAHLVDLMPDRPDGFCFADDVTQIKNQKKKEYLSKTFFFGFQNAPTLHPSILYKCSFFNLEGSGVHLSQSLSL
jgi:hypothetical protein